MRTTTSSRPAWGRRPAAVVACAVAAAALALGAGAPAAVAAESPSPAASAAAAGTPSKDSLTRNVTFGIKPYEPVGATPRGAFRMRVSPGTVARDAVSVYNFADVPLVLQVYAADGLTTATGDFDLTPPDAKTTQVGRWIALDLPKDSSIRVPAKSRVDIPFLVKVPAKAAPGDHAGGIVVDLPATTTGEGGTAVKVNSRVATPVTLRVAGTVRTELAVEDLQADYLSTWTPWSTGSMRVTWTVRNTGNVTVSGRQAARITGPLGTDVAVAVPDLPALLPGSAVQVTTDVPGIWPLVRYTARVEVTPLSAPEDPQGDIAVAETSTWAIPWPQLAAVLLLVLLGLLLNRWRTRPAGGRHGGPAIADPRTDLVVAP